MKPSDNKTHQAASLEESGAVDASPAIRSDESVQPSPCPSASASDRPGEPKQSSDRDRTGKSTPARSGADYFSWQILFCALFISLVFMVAISTPNILPGTSICDSFKQLPPGQEGVVAVALRMQLARAELQNDAPGVQDALRLLADFSLHKGDDKTAAKYLKRLLNTKPLLPFEKERLAATAMLCQIYYDQGRLQDAKNVFEENEKYIFHTRPQMCTFLLASRIYEALGDKANQQRTDNIVRSIRMNDWPVLDLVNPRSADPVPSIYASARACMARGEYAQARKLFQILQDKDLIAEHTDMPMRVQLMLPVVTGLEGNYDQAAVEFAASVKPWNSTRAWTWMSSSEIFSYLNTYADVLRHTGREERANAVQSQADGVERQSQTRYPTALSNPRIRWWKTKEN